MINSTYVQLIIEMFIKPVWVFYWQLLLMLVVDGFAIILIKGLIESFVLIETNYPAFFIMQNS